MKYYLNVPCTDGTGNRLREISEKQFTILAAIYDYLFRVDYMTSDDGSQVHVYSEITNDFIFLVDGCDEDF